MTVSIVPLGVEEEISAREAQFGRVHNSRLISPTQVAASSSQLSDGRVVITYEAKTGVYARIIFADGKVSPEITVEANASSCASVAVWNDGTFVVVYMAKFEFAFEGVYSRVFNPDGSPKSPTRTRIAFGILKLRGGLDRWRVSTPTVATSQQQYKYAVAWSTGRSMHPKSGLSIRVIDVVSGLNTTDEYIVAPPTCYTSSNFNAAVQVVEMFPSLLAWVNQQEEAQFATHQVHTQVHMPNGPDQQQMPFLGDAPTIACLGPTGAPPEQVANESIGHVSYVMAARSDLNPPIDKVKSAILYAIVDVGVATGGAAAHISSTKVTFIGRANELPRSAVAVSGYPAVVGLGGAHIDKFVVCWNDSTNIVARVFDRQGVPQSSETILLEGGAPITLGGIAPCVAALPDGSFYVAWTHVVQIANVAHQTIHGRRFELR